MMDILTYILGQNWGFYSHEKLYAMVRTDAEGVGAVEVTEVEMAQFAALMEESVDDVEQALAEAGVSWQGLAAESMGTGVSPLAQWARDAAVAADASGNSARDVGEAFHRAAYGMPEPVPTPSKTMTFPPTFADLAAAQQDQDAAERAAQDAKHHAVELMQSYSTNSAAAQDNVGTFVPPQGVTVGVPEPRGDSIEVAGDTIERPADSGEPGQPVDGGPPVRRDSDPVGRGGDPGSRETTPGSAPPPGGSSGTDPARVTSPPSRFTPVAGPPVGNPTGTPVTTFGPVLASGPGDTSGRGGRGPGSAPGGGRGTAGVTGRGPASGGMPGRGGSVGAGPLAGEPVAAARGGASAIARPGMGAGGFGPMGAGRRDDEDKERTSPEYLRDYRDDFWDDAPPVAPAVIGDEDDE